MGEETGILWTDHTFNPWIGCTKVSAGCQNCYAEKQDHRWGGGRWGPGATRTVTSSKNWLMPLRWDKAAKDSGERRRVFCASLADVFDEEAPEGARDWLWELIRKTPNLDWQLLTKRPENIKKMLPRDNWTNVWLGTSVEDQKSAEVRIPLLLENESNAARLFLSCEPLIGPVDLTEWIPPGDYVATEGGQFYVEPPIDWVIVGGESGPKARTMQGAWAMKIVQDCKNANVAVFVKQLGSAYSSLGLIRDPKGGNIEEFPVKLQVREFP